MITFANQSALDIRALTTMGVSVKTSDSPIGYFGTGLKFAIATLLRTDHAVSVSVNGTSYTFRTSPETIRGETFQIITMNGTPLGFTTQLGKDWEVWQAYRELRSNAMDEGSHYVGPNPPEGFATYIHVAGPLIDGIHSRAHEIFLEAPAISPHNYCTPHQNGTQYFYYRNVRAGESPANRTIYNWNFHDKVKLTENRTIEMSYILRYLPAYTIAMSDNAEFIRTCLLAPDDTFESDVTFAGITSSIFTPTFRSVLLSLRHNNALNPTARQHISNLLSFEDQYEIVELEDWQERMYEDAVLICRRIDSQFTLSPYFVQTLGDALGLYTNNRVLISLATFDMGLDMLAGTLYEEYLHQFRNIDDTSREMQNYLLNKLIQITKRSM